MYVRQIDCGTTDYSQAFQNRPVLQQKCSAKINVKWIKHCAEIQNQRLKKKTTCKSMQLQQCPNGLPAAMEIDLFLAERR